MNDRAYQEQVLTEMLHERGLRPAGPFSFHTDGWKDVEVSCYAADQQGGAVGEVGWPLDDQNLTFSSEAALEKHGRPWDNLG